MASETGLHMATEVVMPQMGESIAEGTIVRWIKKVGDTVDRDEPLFEISTDKVDAEIPSPAAGVVSEIRVKEGETVPVNSVVAVIGSASAAPSPSAATADKPASAAAQTPPAPAAKAPEPPKPAPQADGSPTASAPAKEQASVAVAGRPEGRPLPSGVGASPESVGAGFQAGPKTQTTEEAIRERSSPLVHKIAKEHNVDISQIHGTGIAGRVTKDDILGYIESAPAAPSSAAASAGPASAAERRDAATAG